MSLQQAIYCERCGAPMQHKLVPAEGHVRDVCTRCGTIRYFNPTPVVGCVVVSEDGRILLARRAIEPRYGLWTLPGGFMELHETLSQGAARETQEEAQALVLPDRLFTVIDADWGAQISFFFLARFQGQELHSPGPESLETRLFTREQIPWETLAFRTVIYTLDQYYKDLDLGRFSTHYHSMQSLDSDWVPTPAAPPVSPPRSASD